MKKYIYIDTKIRGAILQLISYFENRVFDSEYTVIFKLYKTNRKFLKLLEKHNINYLSFSFYREFPDISNSIVFYLFNAQSNCRVVAYREAKHIFVTHGESNKLPSIKPILRIYDYVTVAGVAGCDRLLEYKIFNQCDLQNSKIIQMGNTFIGKLNFDYDKNSNILLYAPTWEGGVKNENYSSISAGIESFKLLKTYVEKNSIDTILIQIHPNTGHRDKRYLSYVYKGIKYLLNHNIKILIKEVNSLLFKITFFKLKKYFVTNQEFGIKVAFCDVSALEVQLLDKNIPYYIFINDTQKSMPNNRELEEYYNIVGVMNYKLSNKSIDENYRRKIKKYYINYEDSMLETKSYREKIDWLIDYIK